MLNLSSAEPFKIDVPQAVLVDLKERLARTRLPTIEAKAPPWTYGTSLRYMREVQHHWETRYDWRAWERRLNGFKHYKAPAGGRKVHFIVEEGSGPSPIPLLITHGWPGSIVEFIDIIEPLAHPERFGGDAKDGFTVIAPSLPGYGFSDAPEAPITPRDVGHIWHELMTRTLGCTRYMAQGGDWGAVVTSWLALDHPAEIAAIHINMTGLRPALGKNAEPPLSAAETAWLEASLKRREREVGYQQIQGTKPQTLSYGLTDSPIGLAAWILEKFHGWTIPGEDRPPPFDLDKLLTNVMLYWLGGMNAATWLYCSIVDGTSSALKPGEKVTVPTGAFLFPKDLLMPPPEEFVRRSYNLTHYRVAQDGGHFPAMENGPLLVEDVRSFLRTYR
jgi:microsomal epoxide hydrolase